MAQSLEYPQELFQATNEEIVYTIDTTEWIAAPTSPVVSKVTDLYTGTNVASTVMPTGSPSVSANIITLPTLKLLTIGRKYRVHVRFTVSTSVYECNFVVTCKY